MKKSELKKKKRKEAEERAELRAKRTDEQQLAKLDTAGWKASKERKRLQARIEVKKKVDRSERGGKNENRKLQQK